MKTSARLITRTGKTFADFLVTLLTLLALNAIILMPVLAYLAGF